MILWRQVISLKRIANKRATQKQADNRCLYFEDSQSQSSASEVEPYRNSFLIPAGFFWYKGVLSPFLFTNCTGIFKYGSCPHKGSRMLILLQFMQPHSKRKVKGHPVRISLCRLHGSIPRSVVYVYFGLWGVARSMFSFLPPTAHKANLCWLLSCST